MHPSVAFSVDDTEDWGLPLVGPGLLLDVPREGLWRHPPSLHVEAAPDYRLRLSSGGQPLQGRTRGLAGRGTRLAPVEPLPGGRRGLGVVRVVKPTLHLSRRAATD